MQDEFEWTIAMLTLMPGDALVVSTAKCLNVEQRVRLCQHIEGVMAKVGSPVPVLVLDGGLKIDVLGRPERSIRLRRRRFLSRFWRSYRGWRRDLGVLQSLRAAWVMSVG